jgi:poly(A) polymerase
LAQEPEQLNPPPLITGNDLRLLGIPCGPVYQRILDAVRDAQLEQRIHSPSEALDLAARLGRSASSSGT